MFDKATKVKQLHTLGAHWLELHLHLLKVPLRKCWKRVHLSLLISKFQTRSWAGFFLNHSLKNKFDITR